MYLQKMRERKKDFDVFRDTEYKFAVVMINAFMALNQTRQVSALDDLAINAVLVAPSEFVAIC